MPKIRLKREKANPVSEVQLRQRSTPYDFTVTLDSQAGRTTLCKGSWRFAHDAYWQAVKLVRHLSRSAMVRNDLNEDGELFGCFVTEIENGEDRSLPRSSGRVPKMGVPKMDASQYGEKDSRDDSGNAATSAPRPATRPGLTNSPVDGCGIPAQGEKDEVSFVPIL